MHAILPLGTSGTTLHCAGILCLAWGLSIGGGSCLPFHGLLADEGEEVGLCLGLADGCLCFTVIVNPHLALLPSASEAW